MNTTITHKAITNLSTASRTARIALGVAFLLEVMTTRQAPLGTLAIWPLLAIYPLFTGLVGWDPLKEVCRDVCFSKHLLHLNKTTRTCCYAIGIAMLSSVYIVTGAPGWLILLPLMAIYPIYIAVLGEEPITALLNINTNQYTHTVSKTQTSVVHSFPRNPESKDKDHHHLAA